MKNLILPGSSIVNTLKKELMTYGFNGFCYHLPLENNYISDVDLPKLKDFRPELIKREKFVIASDKRAINVREYYFRLFADKMDSGLAKKKKLGPNLWDGPNLATSSGVQFQQFLHTNDVHTVINWLVPLHCPWSGMFTLFTSQNKADILKTTHEDHDAIDALLCLYAGHFTSQFIAELNPIANNGLLSKKSLKILALISQGDSIETISENENLSIRGVCYHVDRIKNILKCSNRSQMIYKATKLGLIR